ncbi:MAG: hypothetical protein IT374_06305 [Polyangiaceae bacterium]|nr:hypothetical protein [Polyangiaceae bacterium]
MSRARCLLAVCLLAACAPSRPATPEQALSAYAAAIRERRVEDAYALLSAEARRGLPLEAFRRIVKESGDDMDELARALALPTTAPMVTATLTAPNGEELVLFYEHGAWKIDAASVDLYGQDTPRRALRAFLRAYEKRRWDILLRFVPDAKKTPDEKAPPLDEAKLKDSWEGPQREDMQRIVSAIRAALPDAQIEETGERAAMSYGASGTVLLVRERGLWKIEEFD